MSEQQVLEPIPGPTMPNPVQWAAVRDRTLVEQLMVLGAASGPIFQMPGGPPRNIAVWGFPFIDELSDDKRFDKALGAGLLAVRANAGDGLFTAFTDEPNWGKAHRILMPAFSQGAMETYHDAMTELGSQLVLKWERLNPGETIQVTDDTTRLTLDTIGLCGFDYRFNSFYRSDLHAYVEGMVYSLDSATASMSLTASANKDAEPDPKILEYRTAMNAFVDEIVAARKRDDPTGEHHRDLLQFMLNGVDKTTGEKLDDVTIRYEINTFLVAGHETTSGLLSFALYFLAKFPQFAVKAQEEVDRVFGSDASVLPTYDQVRGLKYVPQILNESLRLWPTAPGFSRRPYESTTLGGTYAIEPTDVIRIITPLLHRDQSVWGPNSLNFDPDHFSPEAVKMTPPNAYKPFGTGQRACIGRQFALQEAALVLGMILQRFDILDPENYQLRLRQTLTIKPDQLTLAVKPRQGRIAFTVGPGRAGAATADVDAVSQTAASATIAAPASAPVVPAESNGAPLLVLFGSNLGSAEDLAYRIANEGTNRGFEATVAPLDDRTNDLPRVGALVVVTASYNGTPPDNAGKFCDWLTSDALPADALNGVQYAVFGCGNHEWSATYQAIPRLIDDGLAAHGASRFYPRGEGDAAADFDDAATAWISGLWDPLALATGLDPASLTFGQAPRYTVEIVSPPANPFLQDVVRPLTVLECRELQAATSERDTRHIEFALPAEMSYQTGDHLGVIPRNLVSVIQRVIAHFNFATDAYVRIQRNGQGAPFLPLDRPVAVLEILSRYVDLQEVASRAQLHTLAESNPCPPHRDELLKLADETSYAVEILAKRVSVLDLLERFPTCDLPFSAYLEMLHPLRVRYYSISSSPAVDPRTCAITVAVVALPARSGQGEYYGVASNYLARHPVGSVIDGYVRTPNLPFRPPVDPLTPIVMVGPGIGLAPFRGFLQDRAAMLAKGKELGTALLFTGCRNADQDFIYRNELETFAKHGIVTMFAAFSRPAPGSGDKQYVQDLMRLHAADVWTVMAETGVFYVCGDGGKMEPAVRQTLIDIAVSHGGMSPDEATIWQAGLVMSNRYLADVWSNS